jgi:translocator protein
MNTLVMKNWQKLVISVIGCEAVGLLGTPFTMKAIQEWYAFLNKPFFSPPNWLFGPVWTILYLMMGVAIYLIWKEKLTKRTELAKKLFLIQLGLNFIWTPIFFGLRSPLMGLIVIVAMWFMILLTIKKFLTINKLAAYLLVPYLMWVSFATILNLAILILN